MNRRVQVKGIGRDTLWTCHTVSEAGHPLVPIELTPCNAGLQKDMAISLSPEPMTGTLCRKSIFAEVKAPRLHHSRVT
jgi:hypothetical protein